MKIPVNGVAFFDSGVGGLTVLNSCQKRLAGECFYYYGDNERAPYGNLAPAQIRGYVSEAFAFFESLQVKCAVIACNTVTALCVEELRERYDFPIVGAEPAIVSAAKRGGEVFVLTTRATFNSLRFQCLCDKVRASYPQVKLTAYACDGLAGEIEEHIFDDSYDFTKRLPRGSPDAVVLGCTHYIYIRKTVQNFYRCEVFDGNEGIAKRLCVELLRGNAARKDEKDGQNSPDDQKNRDGRPLFSNGLGGVGIFDHSLPPNEKTKNFKEKTNECLCLSGQKTRIIHSFAEKNKIYFIGSGTHKNKEFYERMFAFV